MRRAVKRERTHSYSSFATDAYSNTRPRPSYRLQYALFLDKKTTFELTLTIAGIDIFSPRFAFHTLNTLLIILTSRSSIDLSPASNHPKRRIWQEAVTTLFLTSPECGIPREQHMHYAQARDTEFPPYLLSFTGTPGERHVENLKVHA